MAQGRARLAMGSGLSAWALEAPGGFGDAGFHAHHALQLTFGLHGTLALECDGQRIEGPAIAVDADARHRIAADGLLVFVFVEPEGRQGRLLRERLFADGPLARLNVETVSAILAPLSATFEADLPPAQVLALAREVLDALAGEAPADPTDPRVRRVMQFAEDNLDLPLTLASASAGIYLSPSRLRHLFVEETGLPFRTWLLWLRLVRALQAYSEGRTLTEAAHEAGFSDSAHLSRIFRRTFGLPATTLARV